MNALNVCPLRASGGPYVSDKVSPDLFFCIHHRYFAMAEIIFPRVTVHRSFPCVFWPCHTPFSCGLLR